MLNSKTNLDNTVDYSKNKNLLELDKEFTEFLIQNLPGELEKLVKACDENNITQIKFQAHKMMPTLVMMNNEKAAELLKALSKTNSNETTIDQLAKSAIVEVELAISSLTTN